MTIDIVLVGFVNSKQGATCEKKSDDLLLVNNSRSICDLAKLFPVQSYSMQLLLSDLIHVVCAITIQLSNHLLFYLEQFMF